MKKRIASLLLVLALCLGLCPAALAAEPNFSAVKASQDYVEVGTQTAVDGREHPLYIYPAGTTFYVEEGRDLTAWVILGWKFSTLEKGASFYDPDFQITWDDRVFTPEPDVVYLLEETNTMDTFLDTYIMVKSGASAQEAPAQEEPAQEAPAEEAPAEEETPAAVNPFTDVAETSAYYEGILWAVEKGITTGRTETTFVPGENCTEANILTFLWRAEGSPAAETTENPFGEAVSTEAYYYGAALWAYEMGMIDETFAPNTACTRAQAVRFMWIDAGSPDDVAAASFTDVAADADYAAAVNWAVDRGVTNGTGDGTTFSPENVCTRGQIVTFLYRAANYQAAETAA